MVADIPDVRHVIDVQLFDVSGEKRQRGVPGWEEGEGVREIVLTTTDLLNVRRIRIRTEDAE
jgi:hypothetical protein